MITTVPEPIKLWGRGQLTIPKELREALKLDETTTLTIFAIGRCLILTPKRLLRASLAKDIERSMKTQGLSLDELLKALKEERQRYNQQLDAS